MTSAGFILLLPLTVLTLSAIAVMLRAAIRRDYVVASWFTLSGLALAFVTLFFAPAGASRAVTPLLVFDDFARFFIGLIISAAFVVALMAIDYLKHQEGFHEEFFVLLLSATLGSATLAASSHFASFFLGLEILSVSLYGMIAYSRNRGISIEAALKYLVLAAASSAFLVFGMALVYAQTGTMEFSRLTQASAPRDIVLLAGFGLMIVGIGFKLALVPFHLWTPDVYQGAPAPVTAFIATVSKGAVFAVLLRLFSQMDFHRYPALYVAFVTIAIASMLFGSLLALLQNNVKRILAYSSIANLGYLLVAFVSRGYMQTTAAAFYLAAYFVTTLGAFAVVTIMSNGERDADLLEDYRGLFWRRPFMAAVMTAMMFSLAGIPVTAGFVGKFLVLVAGEHAAQWVLVFVLVFASAISLFYYLRVVVIMYMPIESEEKSQWVLPLPSWKARLVLICLLAFLIFLGVYPTPAIDAIRLMVTPVNVGVLP